MSSREKGVFQIAQPAIGQMYHITIIYWMALMAHNRSHNHVLLPSSIQLNYHHLVGDFMTNKSIHIMELFNFQTIG